jgi:hypothetical protein
MSKRHSRFKVIQLAFCPLLMAGCVEGRVLSFVKYQPKDDSFRCMQIFTNLHATDAKDLDHMAALWKRRESIIINPVQINLFSTLALERKGKNKYCTVNLGIPLDKEPDIQETGVHLDTIKVIPGEFYLNSHGNLSYYHQIAVPGKTIDAIVKEVTPLLAQGLAEFGQHQVKLAGQEKVRRLTWYGLRKTMVKEILTKAKKAEPNKDDKGEPLLPLEKASLEMLIKAGADRSVNFSRNRSVFTVVLPLSKKDSEEVMATAELLRETVAERIKAGNSVEEGWAQGLEFLNSIKLRYIEGEGLEVPVDVARIEKILKYNLNPEPDKNKQRYQATVDGIQEHGIIINRTFSIKKLVAEYLGK